MWLWVLLGCGEPISNALFYADEAFLAALPDRELLGAPTAVTGAVVGDEPLVIAAIDAGAALDDALDPLLSLSDDLAHAEPTERHETYRAWDAIPGSGGGLWIRAELVQAAEDLPVDWWIDVAPTRLGPWARVAEGTHGSGGGALAWDPADASQILGVPADRHGVAYGRPDAARDVVVERVEDDVVVATWGLRGRDTLAFSGAFAVTDDAASWPGEAVVVQEDAGGRAEGVVLRDADELSFGRCWDPAGNRVWWGGDAGVTPFGSEAACAVDAD